eukprot:4272-Heterococcus_DN1.PRE.4
MILAAVSIWTNTLYVIHNIRFAIHSSSSCLSVNRGSAQSQTVKSNPFLVPWQMELRATAWRTSRTLW